MSRSAAQQLSLSTISPGQQRRKLTAACEQCRKRKARCSGTKPCMLCQKSSVPCTFNFDRQRRGPQPKSKDLLASKKAGDSIATALPLTGNIDSPPIEVRVAQKQIEIQQVPAQNLNSPIVLEDPIGASRGADQFSWKNAVQAIMEGTKTGSNELKPSLDLISHLVEVFNTYVHNQQTWFIQPTKLLDRLTQQKCTQAFLYGVCAVSVKFSRHPSLMSPSGQASRMRFATQARLQMTTPPRAELFLDRIQSLCLLASYEFGEGNGIQAWCDIAAAYGLMQIAIARENFTALEREMIENAREYMRLMQQSCCLGHKLTPTISLSNEHQVFPNLQSWSPGQQTVTFELLLEIQKFSRTSYTSRKPPPWDVDSDFMLQRQALDRYSIHNSNDLHALLSDFNQKTALDNSTADMLHGCLAWHCSVILLNRVFLPIPLRNDDEPLSGIGSPRTKNENLLQFPSAPALFLRERIRACESSAAIICDFGRELMHSTTFMMPPFLGYCCFQSSIVLINQLRRTTYNHEKVVEDLKVNFTILGAMCKFYDSAKSWVETLFDLHESALYPKPPSGSAEQLFADYFSRFDCIEEPPYVTLEPSLSTNDLFNANHPRISNLDSTPSKSAPDLDNPVLQPPIVPSAEEARKQWLSSYQNSIESHIHDLDGDLPEEPRPVQIQEIESPPTITRAERIQGITSPATSRIIDFSGTTGQNNELGFLIQQNTLAAENFITEQNIGNVSLIQQGKIQPDLQLPLSDGNNHTNQISQRSPQNHDQISTYLPPPSSHDLLEVTNSTDPNLGFNDEMQLTDLDISYFLDAGNNMFLPITDMQYTGSLDLW